MAKAMGVVGEVSGHPVQNDGETVSVACIDQGGKVGWSTEATGGCKKSGRLIAPRSVERMFADRHFLRQLAVAQPTAATLRLPPPRAEMDFIDRYRRAQSIDAGRCRLRLLDRVAIDYDRSRLRPQLGSESE